jgi:hypothetical protein
VIYWAPLDGLLSSYHSKKANFFESAHYQRHLGSKETINSEITGPPRHNNGTLGGGTPKQATSFHQLGFSSRFAISLLKVDRIRKKYNKEKTKIGLKEYCNIGKKHHTRIVLSVCPFIIKVAAHKRMECDFATGTRYVLRIKLRRPSEPSSLTDPPSLDSSTSTASSSCGIPQFVFDWENGCLLGGNVNWLCDNDVRNVSAAAEEESRLFEELRAGNDRKKHEQG